MTVLVLKLVVAYLLGSLSGSLIIGRLRGLDIRTQGSGNAGGTNALRVAGWRFALAVVVIDVGKGALAAWLGGWPVSGNADGPLSSLPLAITCACAFAAVLGHCWPVFFGFRGGKGAGTAAGAVLVMAPWMAALMVFVWLAAILLWRFVGLATVIAALVFPLSVFTADWVGPAQATSFKAFALAVAVLIVLTHRSNLKRMLARQEPRLGRGPAP